MTVANTSNVVKFNGNSSTTSFPFTFAVFATGDVVVVRTSATAVETEQTVTTHYTVTINSDQDGNPGGTVTMLTAPPSGEKLTVYRDIASIQGVDLANQGTFYPEVIEDAFDRLTMLVQELEERGNRSPLLPVSTGVGGSFTLGEPAAGELVRYNAAADGMEASGLSIASIPANVSAAASSASAASDSADAAALSETAAALSETAASDSEDAAALSETAASDSADAAALSATNATNAAITAANDAANDAGGYSQSQVDAFVSDAAVRTSVGAATDSNVFTDVDHTKLNSLGAQTVKLNTKVIQLGVWDVTASLSKDIAHGLTWTKIRTINVIIYTDDQSVVKYNDAAIFSIYNSNITVTLDSSYNSTTYNATDENRGWMTLQYVD